MFWVSTFRFPVVIMACNITGGHLQSSSGPVTMIQRWGILYATHCRINNIMSSLFNAYTHQANWTCGSSCLAPEEQNLQCSECEAGLQLSLQQLSNEKVSNSKLHFHRSFGAGFEWDLQPVWGVGLLRLNRQHWSVQQLPLDGHHPGLASPGGGDDPRHLASRSSLQPGCPWHLLMASSFSTCIFEANILSIFTFINKFQKGSQCLNSIAFGVAIWKYI